MVLFMVEIDKQPEFIIGKIAVDTYSILYIYIHKCKIITTTTTTTTITITNIIISKQ